MNGIMIWSFEGSNKRKYEVEIIEWGIEKVLFIDHAGSSQCRVHMTPTKSGDNLHSHSNRLTKSDWCSYVGTVKGDELTGTWRREDEKYGGSGDFILEKEMT